MITFHLSPTSWARESMGSLPQARAALARASLRLALSPPASQARRMVSSNQPLVGAEISGGWIVPGGWRLEPNNNRILALFPQASHLKEVPQCRK